MTYGDMKHTTAVIKKTYSPLWNQVVNLRVTSKDLKPLNFILFDHDIASSNEKIGDVEFSPEKMKELLNGRHGMVVKTVHPLLLAGKTVIGNDKKVAELTLHFRVFPYLHIQERDQKSVQHVDPILEQGIERAVGGGPLGYPWSDLQQYYLDARKEDRQQNENVKSLQGILDAVTQSTRFATAELWNVYDGNLDEVTTAALSSGNKVAPTPAPGPLVEKWNDLESGNGEFGVHLKFSGLRSTSASFLGNATASQLGANAKESYGKIEKLADAACTHIGEGLEGEAMERADHDLNMLDDFISNPERQVDERTRLLAGIYSASLAVKIRDPQR